MSVTRAWKVYGAIGHRQRESFFRSYRHDFSELNNPRVIEVLNSDRTGTNDFSVIKITRGSYEECELELEGQLSDGVFENSRTGSVEEVDPEFAGAWFAVLKDPEDAWDIGSYSFEEAERMLREQGCGLIAVIVNGDYCKAEIPFDEL